MDSMSKPTQQIKRSASSVSFESTATVYKIRHVNSFSRDEIDSIWYNDFELASIQAECIETIHFFNGEDEKQDDSTLYSRRGLEFMTPNRFEQRQSHRSIARNAVFTVQEDACRRRLSDKNNNLRSLLSPIDFSTNETEALMIAYVYRQYTKKCQELALQQGFDDANACGQIVIERKSSIVRSSSRTSLQGRDDLDTTCHYRTTEPSSSPSLSSSSSSSSSLSRWVGSTKPKHVKKDNLPPKRPLRLFSPAA